MRMKLFYFFVFLFVGEVFGSNRITVSEKNFAENPQVVLLSDKTGETVLEVNFSFFDTKKLRTEKFIFDEISFNNEGRFDIPGVPDIPYIAEILAIENRGHPKIEILETSEEKTFENYNLPPVRESWFEKDGETEYKFSETIYKKNEFFPYKLAELDKPAIFRDFRIARLSIYPIRYNPVTKTLKVISKIRLKITYDDEISMNEKNGISSGKISPTFNRLYKAVIFNYETALTKNGLSTEGGKDLMLCILPDNFYDSFQRYAEWKRKTGIDIKVVKFSEIGANSSNPEIIKSYILEAYQNWEFPPTHVLLVGDKEEVPVRYVNYVESFVNEDYYVELEGDDYIPEMLIGRLTNQTDYKLQVMLDKFIRYEQLDAGDDPEWFTRAAVCSNNYYDSQVKTKRFTARILREDGNFTVVDTLMSQDGCPFTLEDIEEKINAGISFLNYRGESWFSGWFASCYFFTQDDVSSLHNEMKLPFVTSIGCGVAMFDQDENCFGETWLELGSFDFQRGACAFVGPTWNTKTTYNNRIDKGIYVGMFREGMEQPAEALLRGKFYMYFVFGDTYWVGYHFRIFTTLGDPSIHIWKGTPEHIAVQAPDTITVGNTLLKFKVTDTAGMPIENAQIVLYNSDMFLSFETDDNGEINSNVVFDNPGKIYYSVRGSKIKFYEDSLYVKNTSESVGIYGVPSLSDTSGNNNGLIEPNENFNLAFALKNWGNGVARNVRATLLPPDSVTFIQVLTTSPVEYGDMNPQQIIEGEPFEIYVSENAPIGEVVPLTLKIETDSSTRENLYNIEINGCKLRYSAYYVEEIGSERNYKLNPGETARIYVKINNLGKGIGENVSGILRSEDEYISVEDSIGMFGDIKPDSSSINVDDFFVVSVSDDCPENYRARMKLILSTNDGLYSYSTTRSFSLGVSVLTLGDPTGPDEYGYYAYDTEDINYTEAPKFHWYEIDSVGQAINYTDVDYYTKIPLPFDFKFYGEVFDSITISTEGWVALGEQNIPEEFSSPRPIPSRDGIRNLLAAYWKNLIHNTSPSGTLYYYFDTENDLFVIEWEDFNFLGASFFFITFEVVLLNPESYSTKTGDGEIIFLYKDIVLSEFVTVGIENETEDIGLQYCYNNDYGVTAVPLQGNMAVKFTTDPPVSIVDVGDVKELPQKFSLYQNYPNPFNPTTTIKYAIPELRGKGSAKVKLIVYDILGRKVATLVNKEQQAGIYEVRFNASDMSSGIYFYRLSYGGFVEVKKMILLK